MLSNTTKISCLEIDVLKPIILPPKRFYIFASLLPIEKAIDLYPPEHAGGLKTSISCVVLIRGSRNVKKGNVLASIFSLEPNRPKKQFFSKIIKLLSRIRFTFTLGDCFILISSRWQKVRDCVFLVIYFVLYFVPCHICSETMATMTSRSLCSYSRYYCFICCV